MTEPRIFVEDEPPPGRGVGPWLVMMGAAIALAAAMFVLSGQQPDDDQAVVQLPVPSTSSTSTTTTAPTTTSTEPPLILQTWVPSFERTLRLLRFESRTLSVTTWRPASEPFTVAHSVGAATWADFGADGAVLAAISVNSNGQHVLWLGSADVLEPVRISDGRMTAAFHVSDPGSLSVATSDGEVTQITTFSIDLTGGLVESTSFTVDGDLGVAASSDVGTLLSDAHDPNRVTWVRTDGSTELLEAYVPPQSGGPLVYGDRTAQGFTSSALGDGALVELPPGAVSVSPRGRFAIVDAPFNIQIYDLDRDVGVPLTDSVSFVADWSGDDRWFVYVSAIESYRLGELTRYVFVDTESGGVVSVSLNADQLEAPHVLAISD